MAHMASYNKAKPFTESDLDDPENFTNKTSHHKLVKYRDEGKMRKGRTLTRARILLIQSW